MSNNRKGKIVVIQQNTRKNKLFTERDMLKCIHQKKGGSSVMFASNVLSLIKITIWI